MTKLQVIVLAAGQSKRFNTGKTKLLEKVCGQEMILYPIHLLSSLDIHTTVVVGHQAEQIQKKITDSQGDTVEFVKQEKRHSRGHALLCSQQKWFADDIVVMNGDTPFVTQEIIASLLAKHRKNAAAISIVKSHCCESSSASYDHIVKNDDGQIEIVSMHERNATFQESCCVDTGIYAIDREFLQECATHVPLDNKDGHLHIGDIVKEANRKGHAVEVISAPFDRIRSIDTFQDLWCAQQVKRAELIKYWMTRGVHFFTAQNVHLDLDVEIGAGSFIGCGVQLFGKTRIGTNSHVGHFSIVEESQLGDNVTVKPHSILSNTTVATETVVGPFAHLENTTADKTNNISEQKNKRPAGKPIGATKLREFC